jgi:ribonuclease HI
MYRAWFDGGSRGNPGVAGSGWLVRNPQDQIVACGTVFAGMHATNNVAEYMGVVAALRGLQAVQALDPTASRVVQVLGDSKLALSQIQGLWKCNLPHLQVYRDEARALTHAFDHVVFTHVVRALNKEADYLSNVAMDTRQTADGLALMSGFKK